jgi:hypothetical protein
VIDHQRFAKGPVKTFQTSQIHAQPDGMVGETVGFAIALAANVRRRTIHSLRRLY